MRAGSRSSWKKRSPERAIPFFTKVIHQDASCLPCRTMLAVAELDLGDWDGAYRNLADVFNKMMETTAWHARSPWWPWE